MRIFLSHSTADRLFVNDLAIDLKSRGFEVWYSEWELGVGDSLATAIQVGIRKSSWLIVVLSPESVNSKWVREELNAGFARQLAEDRVYILPVLHKDCEIPIFLRDRIYADFRTSYSDGFQRLLWTLSFRYHPESESRLTEQVERLDLGEHELRDRVLRMAHDPVTSYTGLYFSRNRTRSFSAMQTRRLVAATEGNKEFKPSSLTDLWRGLTGKLQLLVSGDDIKGQYDWLGYEYSGVLKGTLKGQTVVFDWSWHVSGAKGSGIFYHRTPNSLTGGWWFKYEEIDAENLMMENALPPRHWEFLRSDAVESKTAKKTKEMPFPFDRTLRNNPCPCGSGRKYKNCCGH